MSKRKRADKELKDTKKQVLAIGATACIPIIGTGIASVLVAKKVVPAVAGAVKKKLNKE